MYRRNKLRSACYFVLNGALATAIVLAALSTYAALPATTAGALDPTFNSVAPYVNGFEMLAAGWSGEGTVFCAPH